MSRKAALIYNIGGVQNLDLLEQLENFRKTNNISVDKMADLLGMSRSAYYNWLNGLEPKGLSIYKKAIAILGGK